MPKYILVSLFLLVPGALGAQLRLTSLNEVQFGNLPDSGSKDLRTLYNQTALGWHGRGLQLDLRIEAFGTNASGRNYFSFQQRRAVYRHSGLELSAGNFYTITGSGLLSHAFELPGVITEDRGSRRRFQIVRDLDGFYGRYRGHNIDVQLLRGTPVNSALPPVLDGIDRRQGTVQGGSLQIQPRPFADVGGGLLQLKDAGTNDLGATTYMRLRLAPLLEHLGLGDAYLDLYGEYAQRDAQFHRWLSLAADLPRALYLSTTFTLGTLGLSLEYKDYRDFQLGEINNPPTLIREHQSFLLNRLTHDILADDETGIQTEISYALDSGQQLTANYTRATRRLDPGSDDDLHLWEVFLQMDSPLGEGADGQIFFDVSRQRILSDERRLTGGTLLNLYPSDTYALSIDLQYQDVNRKFGATDFPYENLYISIELSRNPAWSWALTIQRSNDNLESGAALNGPTYWWGFNSTWQIRPNHSASLFAGKRRFGLACTGGTCYEVLGFEGVELRFVDQFF